ncbi:hypothetical protein HYPSUDRAFT_32483 [Hypholoma sublateritium FD-334 SS-4]|uniref:Uncharacterized protein n=1 Tax=Hypholoma sublateritium (strain FD-334 SS-4) TaxID=945553 RepID=A0A0D2PED6_HYPSF|nr:hypothetical protein HYPSUDRAFT_32483 [Hypholoma sublateritium FD-334 SS-4]
MPRSDRHTAPTHPVLEGEGIEMETLPSQISNDDDLPRQNVQISTTRGGEYKIGIILLLLVVLLWTSSNFLTQDLYEGGYNKPFLVTYMNTSSFALYLIPSLIRRWWSRHNDPQTKNNIPNDTTNDYEPLANEDIDIDIQTEGSLHRHPFPRDSWLLPLTDIQTAHLAFTFCLIWFIANWSVNASLGYTSVASATILSSMSGFFTLTIGRIFRVEKLSLIKIGAVCTSFMGVVLVSLSDSEAKQTAGLVSHPTTQQALVDSRATMGDILALISALFYAMYVILLKVRIKSESRIDMQLFFGFVGLFNILVCWPIGIILHLTGVELFEWPSSRKIISAVLINMAITLSSDYLYVLAMLKTTPLVVTIGLSLTIPVAVAGDFVKHRPTEAVVIGGALLVLLSFVAVGFEDSKDQETTPPTLVIANDEGL